MSWSKIDRLCSGGNDIPFLRGSSAIRIEEASPRWIGVNIYVYIYYVCIYTHTYLYVCVCICVYMCVCVYIYVCIYISIYQLIYTDINLYRKFKKNGKAHRGKYK